MAKSHGLKVIALTDYDIVAGIDEAVTIGQEFRIRVLRRVELSAKEHNNFHILGYCYGPDKPVLLDKLVGKLTAGGLGAVKFYLVL